MKKFLKSAIIFGIVFLAMSVSVRAERSGEYLIRQEGDCYTLYALSGGSETPLDGYDRASDAFDALSGASGSLILDGIDISEAISIGGNLTVSGRVFVSALGSICINSGEVCFDGLDLTIDGGKLRIKSGSLTIKSGVILSSGEGIVLDQLASARLAFLGGELQGSSDSAIVYNKVGTVELVSGIMLNSRGAVVRNEASLFLLGNATVKGAAFDILTKNPLMLSDGDREFSGEISVKAEFPINNGAITPVFYNATEAALSGITLYGEDGASRHVDFFEKFRGIAEKNFGAVYLAHKINYFVNDLLYYTEDKLNGETSEYREGAERLGYTFSHWSINGVGGAPYDFKSGVYGGIDLYANYKLCAPTFSLSSRELVYSKDGHIFEPSDITHPLIAESHLSYEWYKDGMPVSSGSASIKLTGVEDSGGYSLKLTMTHENHSVTVTTPTVDIIIRKATVEVPVIPSAIYTGSILRPEIYSGSLYTVEGIAALNVGSYPVNIELCDSVNYQFADGGKSAVSLFNILPAENYWLEEPFISDMYIGEAPGASALPRFGSANILYSESLGGVYSSEIPEREGVYYMIGEVPESENYSALRSEPIAFRVYSERAVGLSVVSGPSRTEYYSFDELDTHGITVEVTFNSGRRERVYGERLEVSYLNGDSFRAEDTYCMLSYLGASIPLSVNVSRLEYDLSGIVFEDLSVIYDGSRRTIGYGGTLPIGLDGIGLTAEVVGGGVSVGVYTVVLSFESESKEYCMPNAIEASLYIMPFEAAVIFDGLEFVYDGELKTPTAYIYGVDGNIIPLEVVGSRSLAGEYTAVAQIENPKYKLVGAFGVYKIKKADYDLSGVYWSDAEFVYDGNEKAVEICGLPSEVSVIGYADNKATFAGSYTAKVTLSYDESNYNAPSIPLHTWYILKGEYDLSGFNFASGEYVYDGEAHYPRLIGKMPIGKDGIALEYSFSRGIVNVSEGAVSVDIIFKTESQNYETPSEMAALVTVKPRYITVTWGKTEFVYNTVNQVPSATAAECLVSVRGGGIDAGEYTAYASALDENYAVSNSECRFTILKADNYWVEELKISDIFEGSKPEPTARARGGEVLFKYYTTDGALIESPEAYGVYLVLAYTEGDGNYKAISSEPASFEIIEIKAVDIGCVLTRNDFVAFETLTPDIITVFVSYNDGSVRPADHNELVFDYGGEDSLRCGSSKIKVAWQSFTREINLTVNRAELDMSEVHWSDGDFIYDGRAKEISLLGLPSGITVTGYSGNGEVNAGEYTVSAKLTYDSENYNAPTVPLGQYKISKCTVAVPEFEPLIYNGCEQMPEAGENAPYEITGDRGKDVGAYKMTLTLLDNHNYAFPGERDFRELEYSIIPRSVGIKLSDVERYWFEDSSEPYYDVLFGEILSDDRFFVEYILKDGAVFAAVDAPNYSVEVTEGVYTEHSAFSERGRIIFFIVVLILASLILIITVLLIRRERISHFVLALKCRLSPASATPVTDGGAVLVENEKDSVAEGIMSVDRERADALISDTLAKGLITNKGDEVATDGRKKRIINVDTLSENFSAGDKVDVNMLKEKNLVPYDTAYLKVLARGIIDKPLRVYANDFSLSAVKMIALTGGESVKVVTVKKSKKENEEKK